MGLPADLSSGSSGREVQPQEPPHDLLIYSSTWPSVFGEMEELWTTRYSLGHRNGS